MVTTNESPRLPIIEMIGKHKLFFRVHVKKIAFLMRASAKALIPPLTVSKQSAFSMYINICTYMFLKQERPEMDNFERKEKLVLEEKSIFYENKGIMFLLDALPKTLRMQFFFDVLPIRSDQKNISDVLVSAHFLKDKVHL